MSTNAIMQAVGDDNTDITRKRCWRMKGSGLLTSTDKGIHRERQIYSMTANGRYELAKYVKSHGEIELKKIRSRTGQKKPAQSFVKVERPDNAALPRQINVLLGNYVPPSDHYQRNDGHKHIKSLGFR